MKYKNRKQKMMEYEGKFADIPKDYEERLAYLYDKFNLSESKASAILDTRSRMIDSFYYNTISFVLYEIPAGKERPRFRIIHKNQLTNAAINYPDQVQVYSLSGREDHVYMNRIINGADFAGLSQLLCTPCFVEYITYFPTPSHYSQERVFMAEVGLDRPLTKPDFDNIEKKYADMFNGIVWIDDIVVVDAVIRKFYSILPRIEIRLSFLNQVYNKYQYNQMINRKDFTDDMKLDYFGGNKNADNIRKSKNPIKRIV